jgi:hypothetical protein
MACRWFLQGCGVVCLSFSSGLEFTSSKSKAHTGGTYFTKTVSVYAHFV